MRALVAKIAVALVVLLVVAAAGSWFVGSQIVHGAASEVPRAMEPAQDITLKTRDGIKIAGTYWPGRTPNAPAVLLLHGLGASRSQTAANAEWLASIGYAALTIDLRGHGESTITDHTYGLDEGLDARAAFDWLKAKQEGAKVGVIGISLGGAAALVGRDGPVPADALVLEAVFPTIRAAIYNRLRVRTSFVGATLFEPLLSFQALPRYGVWPSRISPLSALRTFRAPVLVIGGEADRYTTPAETRRLYKAAPAARGLWIVPGLDHGRTSSLGDVEWRKRVGAFFAGTIGTP